MQLKLNSTQSPRTQRPFKGLSTTLFMPSNLLHVAASQIALHKPTIMFLVRWPSTLNLHVCIQVDVMCGYTIYSVCVWHGNSVEIFRERSAKTKVSLPSISVYTTYCAFESNACAFYIYISYASNCSWQFY